MVFFMVLIARHQSKLMPLLVFPLPLLIERARTKLAGNDGLPYSLQVATNDLRFRLEKLLLTLKRQYVLR